MLKRLSALVNENVDCGDGSGGSNPTPNSQEGKVRGVGDAPATCHETFLTSQQARYDQQEAFMIIYDHLCKRFFSKHFRADAPSTIIKHGLLENSPFSSVIFPANETSIQFGGTSQPAAPWFPGCSRAAGSGCGGNFSSITIHMAPQGLCQITSRDDLAFNIFLVDSLGLSSNLFHYTLDNVVVLLEIMLW